MTSIKFSAKHTLLSLVCASLAIFVHLDLSHAGAGGSGGGMTILKDGEQKLLTEAGLILEKTIVQMQPSQYPIYYTIPEETKNEVIRIISLIEEKVGNQNLLKEVLGERGMFIDQPEVPSPEFEQMKKDYVDILKGFNEYVDESLLQLPAYSKEGKTYILPLFKTKEPGKELGPTRQALILIHEKFMREAVHLDIKARLAATLELDAQIFRLVNSRDPKFFNVQGLIDALNPLVDNNYKLDGLSKKLMLIQLQTSIKRPLLLGEFITNIPPNEKPKDIIYADPSVVQKFNSIDPTLAVKFEELGFFLGFNRITQSDFDKIDKQCKKFQYIFSHPDALPGDWLIHTNDDQFDGDMQIYQCVNNKVKNVVSMSLINVGYVCGTRSVDGYGNGYLRASRNLRNAIREYQHRKAMAHPSDISLKNELENNIYRLTGLEAHIRISTRNCLRKIDNQKALVE